MPVTDADPIVARRRVRRGDPSPRRPARPPRCSSRAISSARGGSRSSPCGRSSCSSTRRCGRRASSSASAPGGSGRGPSPQPVIVRLIPFVVAIGFGMVSSYPPQTTPDHHRARRARARGDRHARLLPVDRARRPRDDHRRRGAPRGARVIHRCRENRRPLASTAMPPQQSSDEQPPTREPRRMPGRRVRRRSVS